MQMPAHAIPFTRTTPWLTATWVFASVLLLSLPLILNPGYFSHDELQWAALASAAPGQPISWVAWTGTDAFQYRPLTFNLWLWLSLHLFAHPYAFHAVITTWGAANAALLARMGIGFGMSSRAAAIGAIIFALGPYAIYVHGWVATMGDLIWLSCALLIGLSAQCLRRPLLIAWVAMVLTVLGLLGKEAAIGIPPLLAVAWWFDGRKRVWMAATIGASIVVVAYLLLRWDVLLNSPRDGAQYALSIWNAPMRWLEYQLFAQIPSVLETFNTLSRGWHGRTIGAGLLWLGLLAALWRAGPRHAVIFLVAGVAALAAVLPLASSWNHYGYAFAAVTAMVIAAAWRSTASWGRGVIAIVALLSVMHGVSAMRTMRAVGEIQSVFSPALARAVGDATVAAPLKLRLAPGARDWIFVRLMHDVPSYHGVSIGKRAVLVPSDATADAIIQPDGRLTAARLVSGNRPQSAAHR